MQDHVLCGFGYKVVCVDYKFMKDVVFYRGENCVNKFIEAILLEFEYCRSVVQNHFNTTLIMSMEEEERFQKADSCLICNRLFELLDEKVRDHCHVSDKFRGAAHFSCNANFKISDFDVVIDVIPCGLEKYMAIIVNRNLVFIDSMQFMNDSLDGLVSNLNDKNFKYLSKAFFGKCLKLVKEKGVYPYE